MLYLINCKVDYFVIQFTKFGKQKCFVSFRLYDIMSFFKYCFDIILQLFSITFCFADDLFLLCHQCMAMVNLHKSKEPTPTTTTALKVAPQRTIFHKN